MSPHKALITVAHLPRLVDLAPGGPGDHGGLCHFPIQGGSRLCTHRLSEKKRDAARILHKAILSREGTDSTLDADFRLLFNLCTCASRHPQKSALEIPTCEKWKRELKRRATVVKQEPSRESGIEVTGTAPEETISSACRPQTRSQAKTKTEEENTTFRQLPATNHSTRAVLNLDGMELEPYRPRSTITDVLCQKLTHTALKSGTVYANTSANTTQSLVKIGFTTVSASARRSSTGSRCRSDPVTRCETMPMKYAYRAEQLVHKELQNVRFKEVCCRGCGVAHQEWFNVDVKSAIRVIRSWEDWMNLACPYEDGSLTPKWYSTVKAMEKANIAITGQSLLEQFHRESTPTMDVGLTGTTTGAGEDVEEAVYPGDVLDEDESTWLDRGPEAEDPAYAGYFADDESALLESDNEDVLDLEDAWEEDESTLLEPGPDTEDPKSPEDFIEDVSKLFELGPDTEDPKSPEDFIEDVSKLFELGPDAGDPQSPEDSPEDFIEDEPTLLDADTDSGPSTSKAPAKLELPNLSTMDKTSVVSILSELLNQVTLLNAEVRQLREQQQKQQQPLQVFSVPMAVPVVGYSTSPLAVSVA